MMFQWSPWFSTGLSLPSLPMQPHSPVGSPQAPTGVEWEDVSQKWKKHTLQATPCTPNEPSLRVQLGAKGKAKLILQIPLVPEEQKHGQETCHCFELFWKPTVLG